ncbi:MAG: hypothetical protein HKN88_00240 [Gammaproteobacteria bacterium]|nr:hypothetical protein [Gammaproteobacteria bacterium]NNC96478.1 hypothetical protein [Gammaproteobacteria bacterium]NNM13833.1 hypothetical protein [Gammaproteobacteria bacterium]
MNNFLFKILFLTIALALGNPNFATSSDFDWQRGTEILRAAGPDSEQIGTRWGLAAAQESIQITFMLDASNDMSKGSWLGNIRSSEKFYCKVYLLDDLGNRSYLNFKNARATGPDAEYGIWKKGPASANIKMLEFQLDWETMLLIKNAKTLIINYAKFETPQQTRDIFFPLDTFNANLEALEASIKQANGGKRFLMTREEIDNTPVQDLPEVIQKHWMNDISRLAAELGMSVSEMYKYSMVEMKQLQQTKKDQQKAALMKKRKKAHQAIYDQKPDWLDMNSCPNRSISQCNNIGKQAYSSDNLLGEPFHYGTILGVVWRPQDSIVRIYGGNVKLNIDPDIYRAKKAEYYYIVKSKSENLDIRSVAGVTVKN